MFLTTSLQTPAVVMCATCNLCRLPVDTIVAIVAFDISTISGPSSYTGTPNTLQRREIILDTGCGTGKECKFHVVWQYMYTLTTLLMVLYKIYKIYIKKI